MLLPPLLAFVATDVPSDPMSAVVLHLLTCWLILRDVALFDGLPANTGNAARVCTTKNLRHEGPHLDLRVLLPHSIKMLTSFVWSKNGSLL